MQRKSIFTLNFWRTYLNHCLHIVQFIYLNLPVFIYVFFFLLFCCVFFFSLTRLGFIIIPQILFDVKNFFIFFNFPTNFYQIDQLSASIPHLQFDLIKPFDGSFKSYFYTTIEKDVSYLRFPYIIDT